MCVVFCRAGGGRILCVTFVCSALFLSLQLEPYYIPKLWPSHMKTGRRFSPSRYDTSPHPVVVLLFCLFSLWCDPRERIALRSSPNIGTCRFARSTPGGPRLSSTLKMKCGRNLGLNFLTASGPRKAPTETFVSISFFLFLRRRHRATPVLSLSNFLRLLPTPIPPRGSALFCPMSDIIIQRPTHSVGA